MDNKKKNTNKLKDVLKPSKNNSEKTVEVEIEKNFFVITREPDKVRLEKWKIGRRNFPQMKLMKKPQRYEL